MSVRWQSYTKGRYLTDEGLPRPGGGSRLRLGLMGLLMMGSLATLAWAQGESSSTSSNMQAWLGVDLFSLIRTADNVGKSSLIVLACFSIISISVIVYKYLHIRQAIRQTEDFVELCNQGTGVIEDAFRVSSEFPDSPLAQILREAYLELEMENWYRSEGYDLTTEGRVEIAKAGLDRVFERAIANEITHLESKLIFLATTSSVCPFIGLFGTVWGIMGAFQALATSGGGTLVSLGPSLSTALLTTVGGLFCAIPATVMYNVLTHKIRNLIAQMDSFALELSGIIHKQILKQSAGIAAR